VTSRILSGEIIAVSRMADLPPEADRDRESFILYGSRSSLMFPLSVGSGPVFGVLSFAMMTKERDWPEETVSRLQMVSQIFANALARKRSDEALRDNEARLELAADSAGAGLWSLDISSGIFWVNQRARLMFGFSPDETVTFEGFLNLVHPGDRDMIRGKVRSVVRTGGRLSADYRIIRPDGAVRWISSRGRPGAGGSGKPDHLTGISVDVTEHKIAEEAARELSGRLISAHEEERARLARELHDDLTQRLARLAIDAGLVESMISDSPAGRTISSLREGLVRLSEDIHALSYRLHPSILEDLGLAEALRTEIERCAKQDSLSVTAGLDGIPENVPRDVALCLFRVAQEGMRNVVRHAGAGEVELSVRKLDGGLQLAVRDDGAGFDPSLRRDGRKLGLTSMLERVRLLGGTLDIESAPGRGTAVIAWVPLKEE
jgi:PAS domain S-box-containing protein